MIRCELWEYYDRYLFYRILVNLQVDLIEAIKDVQPVTLLGQFGRLRKTMERSCQEGVRLGRG